MRAEGGPSILLCGPFPHETGIGGYARVNAFVAGSALAERLGIAPLPVTVPADGSAVARLGEDFRRARRALAAPGVRILHVTAQYHAGTYREWLQYRLARRHGVRFLLDIRGGCFVEAFEDPRRPLQRALWARMLRGADAITVEGRSDADWIARRFGRSASWLPNFVRAEDAARHAPAPLAPPAPGRPLRLFYAGAFREEKGLLELVQACGLLHARGVPVRLELAGAGEPDFEARLAAGSRDLPAGTLERLGRLEHEALLEAMRHAHVFVFPSRWRCEGHSNALNEAMQSGLPVVASRQGFSPDVVTPDCGMLLDAVTPPAIADAVSALQADWPDLVARGRAARARVYALFSDASALARLGRVYESLLGDAADG